MNFFDPESRKNSQVQRVSMALFRLSQAIKKLNLMESETLQLTPVQIQTLFFIAHTREDMCSVGNLAKSIATTHATAVDVINGLVAKGFVAKSNKPEDRRVTILRLTIDGKQAVQAAAEWGAGFERVIGSISEKDLKLLETGLGALVHSMQTEGYLVVGEPCLGCVHFQAHAQEGEEPHYCNLVKKYLRQEASEKECPDHTPMR